MSTISSGSSATAPPVQALQQAAQKEQALFQAGVQASQTQQTEKAAAEEENAKAVARSSGVPHRGQTLDIEV